MGWFIVKVIHVCFTMDNPTPLPYPLFAFLYYPATCQPLRYIRFQAFLQIPRRYLYPNPYPQLYPSPCNPRLQLPFALHLFIGVGLATSSFCLCQFFLWIHKSFADAAKAYFAGRRQLASCGCPCMIS